MGDELAQDAYRNEIRRKILTSIASYTTYGSNRSGSNVAESSTLSSTKSTQFLIELEFDRSKVCVDQIVSAKDSDFSRKLTDRSPPKEEVAANPPANKSPEREQNRTAQTNSRSQQTLPATRVHSQGSPESTTPEKTPSPVLHSSPNTVGGVNTNVGRTPSETPTPQSTTNQDTNTNQNTSPTARSNNSNMTQRAAPSPAKTSKRKRSKKGRT